MVSVNLDARVRQREFAFFFLGAFLLLNIPSKHEIIHSWVPVFGRKKGVELTDSVCFCWEGGLYFREFTVVGKEMNSSNSTHCQHPDSQRSREKKKDDGKRCASPFIAQKGEMNFQ